MGMFDKLRKSAEDAVDKHGDKIASGADKAGAMLDKKTGGKYTSQINSGIDKTKTGLDNRKETGMSASKDDPAETTTGPANPQGSADMDAPTPPGGPNRTDAAAGPFAPGRPGGADQSGQARKIDEDDTHTSPSGAEAPVEPGSPKDPADTALGSDSGHVEKRPDPVRNAGSSQVQPSDGSGDEGSSDTSTSRT